MIGTVIFQVYFFNFKATRKTTDSFYKKWKISFFMKLTRTWCNGMKLISVTAIVELKKLY